MPDAKLYIVVPVFNEAANVGRLINGLSSLKSELSDEFDVHSIFVDDGSSDATISRIEAASEKLAVSILRHETNRGPGAAFATGFAFLRGRLSPKDWVVTMEGDNTSDLSTLRQMLVRRLEGYDVVLASPYAYGGGFSNTAWHRVLLSHCANGLAKLVLGIHGIHTLSSFFRLYSGRVICTLYNSYGDGIIELSGFEGVVELLHKLVQIDATMSEVPMKVDRTKSMEPSKMKVFRTIAGYFHVFARSRSWRL